MTKPLNLSELQEIHDSPFLDLVFRAAQVHREHHDPRKVQVSTLISIKTGGCPEDCAYCPQAARYHTGLEREDLLSLDEVTRRAQEAKDRGASRLCMGAAWREVRDNSDFERVLEMVRSVNGIGLEVCCTLGMLSPEQAQRLADAGLYAYNHNVDTSPEYYDDIISTRTYDDRLETLGHVRKAGVTLCSGGIIGMGESVTDRLRMVEVLGSLDPPPESIPINALVPVEGTPLADQELVSVWDMVRMIATVRIAIPTSIVRLSAGRTRMGMTEQALCFMAGAGSIFSGEKLLTTPNPDFPDDERLFETLGLERREPFAGPRSCSTSTQSTSTQSTK